eukprot:211942_1
MNRSWMCLMMLCLMKHFIECILIFIGGMSAHFIGLCISVFNIYCMVNLERICTRKDECNCSTFRAPFPHQLLGIRIDLIPVFKPLTNTESSLKQMEMESITLYVRGCCIHQQLYGAVTWILHQSSIIYPRYDAPIYDDSIQSISFKFSSIFYGNSWSTVEIV